VRRYIGTWSSVARPIVTRDQTSAASACARGWIRSGGVLASERNAGADSRRRGVLIGRPYQHWGTSGSQAPESRCVEEYAALAAYSGSRWVQEYAAWAAYSGQAGRGLGGGWEYAALAAYSRQPGGGFGSRSGEIRA